ncbi:UNVERIFIED_CONTAM: hypothetical protein GTU68_013104 [Idotea baltica]|nr:hypothetical protein [Idotea baltica]
MKIISFNINSIRARLHQLEAIINKYEPDIIGLQETKVSDESFPLEAVENLGYHAYYHGQKGHYGVALLSRQPAIAVHKGFPCDNKDSQKRFISASFQTHTGKSITIMNGYFPQGESRKHPTKFPAKQDFYKNLQELLENKFTPDQSIVLMGDINISPEDIDIGIGDINKKRWLSAGKCSFLPEEREWLARLKKWGFIDSYRYLNPTISNRFSWFDYRSKGFNDSPKRGLRIDVLMVSTSLTKDILDTGIDYDIRAMEKPSDHAPIWLKLEAHITTNN